MIVLYKTKALLVFAILCFVVFVDAANEFIVPSASGLEVLLGSSVRAEWTCDDCGSKPMSLNVYQNWDNGGGWAKESLLVDVLNPGNYTWLAHTLEGNTIEHGFHFEVAYDGKVFNSGALFIRDKLSSSSSLTSTSTADSTSTIVSDFTSSTFVTTSSLSTSSPGSSTTSAIDTATGPSTLASASTSATANSDNNDQVLKVGLGIGIGIGIPFLLLIGGILGYIVFKKRVGTPQEILYEQTPEKSWYPFRRKPYTTAELSGEARIHELHQESRPHELPG